MNRCPHSIISSSRDLVSLLGIENNRVPHLSHPRQKSSHLSSSMFGQSFPAMHGYIFHTASNCAGIDAVLSSCWKVSMGIVRHHISTQNTTLFQLPSPLVIIRTPHHSSKHTNHTIMSPSPKWVPLENDTRLLNKYISNLGVDLNSVEFHDILGFDEDLLAMVPRPVLAVLLLFPLTKENEEMKKKEEAEESKIPKDVWYTKQTIGNACGTIGILHALANNINQIKLKDDDCFIKNFLKDAEGKTPDERAKLLENNEEISQKHDDSAKESSLETNEQTDVHFVTFIQKNGEIYEMDGRRSKPQFRGNCSEQEFLSKAARICADRMKMNPNDWHKFSAMALCRK